jgi:hypothetical protein
MNSRGEVVMRSKVPNKEGIAVERYHYGGDSSKLRAPLSARALRPIWKNVIKSVKTDHCV